MRMRILLTVALALAVAPAGGCEARYPCARKGLTTC